MPENKYSTNFSKRGGYIFSGDSIRSIANNIASFTQSQITIGVSLADGHNVQSSDIDDVLTDSYITNRIIEKIEITSSAAFDLAKRDEIRNYVHLNIRKGPFWYVDVSISGERKACSALRGELETIIEGQKQWYAWTFQLPMLIQIAVIIVTAALLFFATGSAFIVVFGKDNLKDYSWTLFVLVFAGLWCVDKLKQKMFPRVAFNIGKSGDEIQVAKQWRNVAFGTLIAGIFVSVAGSFIYDRLK